MRGKALRHRVQIMLPKDQPDTLGDSNTQYTPGPIVYAAIEAGGAGSEVWQAQQAKGKQAYTITIRYRDDVTAKCKIAWPPPGDAPPNYPVRFFECGPPVDTDFRHIELVIPCVENAK